MRLTNFFIFTISILLSSYSAASISVKKTTASSVYPSDGSSYYPRYATDRNSKTAWFPKKTNRDNSGQWIKFEFDKVQPLAQLKIINGWTKSRSLWRSNSRVKNATLTFSNGKTHSVTLKDTDKVQTLDIPLQYTQWVKLTINNSYRGRYNEAGLTQISFYIDPAITKAKLIAQQKKAKEIAKKRAALAAASKKQYLKNLQNSFISDLKKNDSGALIGQLNDHLKAPKYPEVTKLVHDYFGKMLSQEVNRATTATGKLDLWKTYHTHKLAETQREFFNTLRNDAFTQAKSDAEKAATSTAYIEVYKSFNEYLPDSYKPLLQELMHSALTIDNEIVATNFDLAYWQEQLPEYSEMLKHPKIRQSYDKIVDQLINIHFAKSANTSELTKTSKKLMALPLTSNQQGKISQKLLEVLNISLRYTFREGKIGDRYVTRLNHTQSSNTTRYINGVALNETKYKDYSTGGYDESRHGFTSVFQMFNESSTNYIVTLSVTATKKMSEYRSKSSWSGKESRHTVQKESKLRQVTTYLLKANSELKDQLVVGENKPKDFIINVVNVIPVEADWIDNLAKAQDGDNLGIAQRFISDDRAINWRANIGENFAKLAYMNLDIELITTPKFDKDFNSQVTVKLVNNNSIPVALAFSNNFNTKASKATLAAKSTKNITLPAKGKRKRDLAIYIDMLEPVD